MKDTNYDELFGVDTAESDTDGAKDTELADPQEEESVTGEKEAETADPQREGEEDEEDEGEGEGDENAKYAAARRKAEAERDASVRRAREEAEIYVSGAIKALGLKDPDTGKIVETREEYDAYRRKKLSSVPEKIKNGEIIDEDEVDDYIKSRVDERLSAARAEEEAKNAIDAQIAEISRFEPDVKSLSDLKNLDCYDKIYDGVKRGMTILDAYKLANLDNIASSIARAKKSDGEASEMGRKHLVSAMQRGARDDAPVPADILAEYRLFNPTATDEEIRKHYNKEREKGRKQ